MRASWLEVAADGVVFIQVHVQPGARRTEIVGEHDNCLKVRLAAQPVDGKANAALTGYLADRLGLRARDVELVSGQMSRRKRLKLTGASADWVSSGLVAKLTPL